MQITRGLPHLRKLREIMDHIYALFDRRCRTQTRLQAEEAASVGEAVHVDWGHVKEGMLAASGKALTFLTTSCCQRPPMR